MTHARKSLISLEDTPYYHCVSRCVRRAFLWGADKFSGRDYSHRKQWVIDRLATLVEIFAVDICAYAVMSNHYHVVLHVDRERAQSWTDKEVIERWSQLFGIPLLVTRYQSGTDMSAAEQVKVSEIIQTWRERLHDVSWFMRCLNEHLARLANAEDGCKGRFWEGRFKSQALLDEAGLLTCISYVDLNPIRAGIASTPEDSEFTSIYERLRAIAHKITNQPSAQPSSKSPTQTLPPLLPFQIPHQSNDKALPMYLNDYLALVDWTGRAIRDDKRGHIPEGIAPILARLGIDPKQWLNQMQPRGNRFGRAIGRMDNLRAHASALGQRWIKGIFLSGRLYADV